MEKSCFVLAYLTSRGRLPLLALNDVMAGVLRGWPSHRVGWILLQAFHQRQRAAGAGESRRRSSEDAFPPSRLPAFTPSRLLSPPDVSQQLDWLLELMGHIRNIACGRTDPRGDAGAVGFWCDRASSPLAQQRPLP